MEAMLYEYLIRRVYQCGRNFKKGADADIYRDMEHAHNDLTTKSMFNTQSEREVQFNKCFATVRRNVREALEEGVSNQL